MTTPRLSPVGEAFRRFVRLARSTPVVTTETIAAMDGTRFIYQTRVDDPAVFTLDREEASNG